MVNKTILVVGDYDKSYNTMKKTICKNFKKYFAGYKTYLVIEFRTSNLAN
jgi:hypothetical protein